RHNPGKCSARDPFQLLPQNAAWRAEIANQKNGCRREKASAHITKFKRVQCLAVCRCSQKRKGTCRRNGDMHHKQHRCRAVHRRELRPQFPTMLRKHQRKVDQQRGLKYSCSHIAPVDRLIKRVPLPRVMKRVKNERDQAENVKMHRPRRIPSACKNKETDKEIKQSGHAKVVFSRRDWRRGRNQRKRKRLAIARDLVAQLRPCPCPPQNSGDIGCAANSSTLKGGEAVATPDAGCSGRRAGRNRLCRDAVSRVNPSGAIRWWHKPVTLLEIEHG